MRTEKASFPNEEHLRVVGESSTVHPSKDPSDPSKSNHRSGSNAHYRRSLTQMLASRKTSWQSLTPFPWLRMLLQSTPERRGFVVMVTWLLANGRILFQHSLGFCHGVNGLFGANLFLEKVFPFTDDPCGTKEEPPPQKQLVRQERHRQKTLFLICEPHLCNAVADYPKVISVN